MAQYDEEVALALELIEEFGESSVLSRKADGTPADSSKPWEPGAPTDTPYTVFAAWLDHESARQNGFLVEVGQQVVFVPASGLAITPDPTRDHITRASGEKWTIDKVSTLSPSGQDILHTLMVSS